MYNTRVTWTPLKIYALKLALFTTVLGYMTLDLMVLHGPVYQFLHAPGKTAPEGVAIVNGERISPAQFARYAAEQNVLSGREGAEPAEGQEATLALGMVREAMVRLRTRYNDLHLPDMHAVAEEEVARLESRCTSTQSFEAQLASQGYTRRSFTDKVETRLRGMVLLDRAVEKVAVVENPAIVAHYRQLKEELTIPASRPVRHIFFAFEENDPAAVRNRAELALKRLQAGEDFSELAAELSEDERSREDGGRLGTLYDDGRTPLPELPLFGENAIAAGEPVLAESRWGCHILLAGPVTPAYTPSLDECRETLRTAIISAQRELGLNSYFKTALNEGLHSKHIQIHVK